MSNVTFSCTSLVGSNKVGKLEPDADGYYTMVIGALNVLNSAGAYYSYDGAKDLFEGSSQFMRRVSRGSLRGEVGHPIFETGMTGEDYVSRILEIRETNVCVHFKEVWLDFDSMKDKDGRAIVAIMSKLIPSGPFGPMLEKQLKNKGENVCFSVRSFTDDSRNGGVLYKSIRNIVTFDNVNEPGIHVANKWLAPGLESLSEKLFTDTQIVRACNKTNTSRVATESSKEMAGELLEALGLSLPHGVKPAFTNW